MPAQLVAHGLLERFDSLVAGRRAMLEPRRTLLAERLAEQLPEWEQQPTAGGLSLWVRLPIDDAQRFVPVARASGVEVLAGAVARADGGADPHLRLAFDRAAPQLDEAADRLAQAWRMM